MKDDIVASAIGAGEQRSVRVEKDAPGTMWLLVAMVAIFGLAGLAVIWRLGWGANLPDARLHEFARAGLLPWVGLVVLAMAACTPWLARTKVSAGPLQIDLEGKGGADDSRG